MFWEDAGAHESLCPSLCSFSRPWMSLSLSLGFLLLVGCTIIPKRKSVLSLISSQVHCRRAGEPCKPSRAPACKNWRGRGAPTGWQLWISIGLEASSNQNPGPSASKASMPQEHTISNIYPKSQERAQSAKAGKPEAVGLGEEGMLETQRPFALNSRNVCEH